MDKKTLRSLIFQELNKLSDTAIQNAYSKILQKHSHFWEKNHAHKFLINKNIALYMPQKKEAHLNLFFQYFINKKSHLFFPRITNTKNSEMEFIQCSPLEPTHWTKGAYGIKEPIEKSNSIIINNPHDLHIIFTPCVALHKNGARLGKGKGYYDRFLSKTHTDINAQPLKVACVLDFQLVDDFLTDSWDHSIDWVLTEKREIKYQGLYDWCKRNNIHSNES